MSRAAAKLFVNGPVVTVDDAFSVAEAALVVGPQIAAVGTRAAVEAAAPAGAEQFDLGGRTLMPGFVDTHGHVGLFGLDELKVALAGARTREAVLERVAAAARDARPGAWIVCMPIGEPPYFLDADALRAAGAVPTAAELDAAAPGNPVYIQAPTNRVPNFALLNTAALEAADVAGHAEVSPHTRPERDANGALTGLVEGAMQPIYNFDPLYQRVEAAAPAAGYADVRDGIAALAPKFARHGTTTLLEAHLTQPEELRAYAELMEAGRLPLRIHYTFEIDFTRDLAAIGDTLRTLRFAANGGFGTPALRVCGVSIGLDGPYWHGAAVHDAPYPGPFGDVVDPEPLVPREHYRAIVALAASMGFRVHAEAAGRGSIGIALDAFEAVDRDTPIRDRRFVLEHCEFPTRAQIATCARLGVAPTTSTNFIWGKGAEVYRERLGADLAEVAIPMRDWLDGGVPIAQSTDWGPHEGFFTLWQSLARQAGLTGEVVGPSQRITRAEAIRAFTANGAWAMRMDHAIGSIVPGKRADLIVVNGDVLGCEEDALRELEVDLTLIDGESVWSR